MGNKQQHRSLRERYHDVIDPHIQLNDPDAIYLPNGIVSGSVIHLKQTEAFILLTDIVHFNRHQKKKHSEANEIIFFSRKSPLSSALADKQNFDIELDEHLPPSFNNSTIYPNISYSISLVYQNSKERTHVSIPIRVCPSIQIGEPLLLTSLFFGPIENKVYHTRFEAKINRSAFTCNDVVHIYYELQNPQEELIHRIDVSLGVYYLVECNAWQEDIIHSIDNTNDSPSNHKLIRNKALLNIPNKVYLPPTIKFKHDQDDEKLRFNLSIDYKIQFRISLGEPENLWEVDVPIILCKDIVGLSETKDSDIHQISVGHTDATE